MKFAIGLLISLAIATPVQSSTPSVPVGGDSQSSTPSLPFGGDTNALEANQLCPNDLEAGQIDALSQSLDQLTSRLERVDNRTSQLYPIIRSLQKDLHALKQDACINNAMFLVFSINLLSFWLVQGFSS